MGRRHPGVDAYIVHSAPFARPILKHLRQLVHTGCPEVEEKLKWGFPHFDYKGMFCHMAAFKAHAIFGFWKSGLLMRGKGSLARPAEKAMGDFGRITSVDDLPSDRTLIGLVRRAKKLNDEGVKVARRKPAAVRAARPPAWFMSALRKNAKALAAFQGFSPSQKRAYVEWISEAKREDTRARRMAQAVAWMAAGKSRNWKYERK